MGQIGSVYKQPETEVDNSCHSWRVPSKWKGTQRGAKGNQQGEQGELRHVLYCQRMIERLNDISYCVQIIITGMNAVDNLNSV